MSWVKLFPERYPEVSNALPDSVMVTSTHRTDNPQSFGHEFNLIKAVAEYGPQRMAEINKRLTAIEQETSRLMEERTTLEALVKVVKPVP